MIDGTEQRGSLLRRLRRRLRSWLLPLAIVASCVCGKERFPDNRPPPPPPPGNGSEGSGSAAAPGSAGSAQAGESVRQLTWNVWAEDGRAWKPVPVLEPEHSYRLVVDLAGIAYARAGVGSVPSSPGFRPHLEQALVDRYTALDLQLLVLPDPLAFRVSGNRWIPLKVDLTKMDRDFREGGAPPPETDVMDLLANDRAEFSYGLARLPPLTTTQRTGRATIAVAIWDHMMPLDQFVVSLCVARDHDDCDGGAPELYARTTLDWLYAVPSSGHSNRDATAGFQFFERDKDVEGVFRRADDPSRVVTWNLGAAYKVREELMRQLEMFSNANTDAGIRPLGHHIAEILFGNIEDVHMQPDVLRFLNASPQGHPTLVVRMIPQTSEPAPPIPLALAAPKGARAKFLGERYDIDMPLEHTLAKPPASCAGRWIMVMPPESEPGSKEQTAASPELNNALAELRAGPNCCLTLGHCDQTAVRPRGKCTASYVTTYFREPDLARFSAWISEEDAQQPSSVLTIFSHHDRRQFYFLDRRDGLFDVDLHRSFDEPSLAILAACNTGSPDGARLLRRLNAMGFTAIIATNAKVAPRLAADFLDCFMGAAASPANRDATVDTVFGEARRCVSEHTNPDDRPHTDDQPRTYGAQAFKFFLAGNGNFNLCAPDARSP